MKRTLLTYLISLCIFIPCIGQSTDFIFVVEQTTNEISFYGKTESSFEVDWENNGQWEEISTNGLEQITRTLSSAPDTIRIKGELNHFRAPKTITDVVQWGNVAFTSLSQTFKDCHQLVSFSAEDTPDLSGVEDMNLAFAHTEKFNGDISNWDVSNVTNMAHMFHAAESFNQDLNNWNVSSVVHMYSMFDMAESFNQSLEDWDVSSVINMYNIFINTALTPSNFDRTVKKWSKLEDLEEGVTFGFNAHYCSAGEALSLLENTNGWVLPEDRVQSCDEEFVIVVDHRISPITFGANTNSSFFVDWENDGNWAEYSTNGMETISYEFTGSLDTIRIKGELNHFHAPKRIKDVVQWGDVYFTSLQKTFQQCSILESFSATDVPNLSDVTDMSFMFGGAMSFNGDISLWDVSNVESMRSTFYRTNFNQDLSKWDVSNVINMSYMFSEASDFNQDLSNWDISSVVNMQNMLSSCGIDNGNYDSLLKGWSALPELEDGVQLDISAEYCEASAERQSLIDNYGWRINDVGACEDILKNEDFIIVVDGSTNVIEFRSVSTASSFDIDWENNGNWETISTDIEGDTITKYISHNFNGAAPDTIRIKGELNHFKAPLNIIDVVQWGSTNFTSMKESFEWCTKLEKFTAKDSLNLSNVESMEGMFVAAFAFNGDLSDWDVSSVTNMEGMFAVASAFNGDLSNWDVSSVTNMESMFVSAFAFNGDLSNWDVSSVTNMRFMFDDAQAFNGDLSTWNVSNVVDMHHMFLYTGLSSDNYDKLLIGWSKLGSLQRDVDLHVSTKYCEGADARDRLITTFGWNITGDKKSCPNESSARTSNSNNHLLEESDLDIESLHGNLEWKLYDFTGQLIDSGSLTIQEGEPLKWWDLQKEFNKAGILRITDDSGKVAVKKFIKQ
ncbi:BspA family leucine-rich repeat surface protein [Flammeovirga aprica]|uniref:DUF285 domain-containing protein n=1 Tax=Flammeovirga aprica JL-4 TaxID=694437 RepID=A0A7X9RW52_9BACT|nr:BspA family leucine-rich repeat surface protein [Flammeovirga aprica]NME69784.1 DUF285 domain-containing protein [Flammeovirga aprica JL-4]